MQSTTNSISTSNTRRKSLETPFSAHSVECSVRSVMGGIKSVPSRILKNWNVENRAFRAIDKADRPAPPRYPTEKKMIMERTRAQALEGSESVPGLEAEKDPKLNNWLKQVKVYSQDVPLHQQAVEHDPRRATSLRDLPQNRVTNPDTALGYEEPAKVPLGKVTLKQAMEIMSLHQEDPVIYNATLLAKTYKCRTSDIEALLQYFRVFLLHIPKTQKTEPQTFSYAKAISSGVLSKEEKFFDQASMSEIAAYGVGPSTLRQRRALEDSLDAEDDAAGPHTKTEGERRFLELEKESVERAKAEKGPRYKEPLKFPYEKWGAPRKKADELARIAAEREKAAKDGKA
ncbi:hypothetical protein BV898_07687 [Hypsibius exemplaris]|uniref:Uncharacterized protein n=1 Tax=Hypsibius exemplaris TaxID=2072580 RepID=A0A1W0WSW2_HYPEX|nr:hypothetical protein BV898_07687 [Hypsibius exemplaris]